MLAIDERQANMDNATQDALHDHIPTSKASSTTSSIRGRVTSTSDKRTRRPAASRRTSTHPNTKPRPEFSVDDNESEVEEDLNTQRIRATVPGSTSFAQMRRQSLLRRRSTAIGSAAAADDEHTEHSDMGEDDGEGEDEGEEGTDDESYEPSEADSVESFTLKARNRI